MVNGMKKALVHEWFVDHSGSEKCAESFTNIWNNFDIYSLVDFLNDDHRNAILKGKKASTSFVQNLPFARNHFRKYFSLFPFAIEQFDLSEYDLIFSNSHAFAKGVLTRFDQLHICYCHSPIRYAWDLYHQYLREAGLEKGIKAIIAKRALHRIRIWDYTTRNRVTHFIANSKYTADRINKIYGRNADVIYPPVNVDQFEFNDSKDSYYLTASRLVYYKKIDMIVEAFAKMPDKKLVVIGDGSEMKKIKAKAAGNIEILGYQPFDELKKYMKNAKAFVFAALEDFGIVNIEAQACGTPVIALNKGGTAETVTDGVNGVHFNNQSPEDIISAVERFESMAHLLQPRQIREKAEQFSRQAYEANIKSFVENKANLFFNNVKNG